MMTQFNQFGVNNMIYINIVVEESEMSLQEIIDTINSNFEVIRLEISDEDQDLFVKED